MSHHAVDPDRPQKHGQNAKENHQVGYHAVPGVNRSYQVLEWLDRRDRLVAVHSPNRVADSCGHYRGVTGRAYDESESPRGKLRQRNIDGPPGTFAQVVHLNVIYYANNRADGMLLAQSKLLPDGVFARQNLSGHSLTYNYGRRSSIRVGGIEKAAFDQPNLHRREIIR